MSALASPTPATTPATPALAHDPRSNVSNHYNDFFDFYRRCGLATVVRSPEVRAAELLESVLYPFLLVVGTLGNVSCVAALVHLSHRAWSTCLYLAVLAAVELVVLYIRCGGTWFLNVVGVNPFERMLTSSDALCKTLVFMLNLLQQMCPWLLVALSLELLISTRYPLRTYHLCTGERARAALLLLTILLVCLNLNYFWTWGLVDDRVCVYIEEISRDFMNDIWPGIAMAVEHALPLVVVAVAFFVSVLSLLRAGRDGAASYEPVLKKYFLDLQALEQLKLASLVVVLLFLIVKTFTFVVELVNALEMRGFIKVPCERQAQYRAGFMLVQTVRDACVYCFLSLKFFVYFGFCVSFRQRVFLLLRKVFFCRRGQRHQVVTRTERNHRPSPPLPPPPPQVVNETLGRKDVRKNSTSPCELNGVCQNADLNKVTHV